jgi:hypothetical protein
MAGAPLLPREETLPPVSVATCRLTRKAKSPPWLQSHNEAVTFVLERRLTSG